MSSCLIVILMLAASAAAGKSKRPSSCSNHYDYVYKIQQQLVAQEHEQKEIMKVLDKLTHDVSEQSDVLRKQDDVIKKQNDVIKKQDDVIRQQGEVIKEIKTSQEQTETLLDHIKSIPSMSPGATYVRWGATTCPGSGTETVYAGFAGGSRYSDSGAAANTLCLPNEPLWSKYVDRFDQGASIDGVEYNLNGAYSKVFFDKILEYNAVPCAVCRSVRNSALMVPARNVCYPGWTLEYSGYLVAGRYDHYAASEFVCLDKSPEFVDGRTTSNSARLFYMAEARCGAMKCPPYVEGREITCAVCTK